ncbi:ferritin-like domain-containing protein, partial [Pseudomonas aeruginosa]
MNPNTVPPAARDVVWIKHALQTAIELEYSTLPLYLSAMFSLEVQNYTAYNAIRSIAMEEMVHMAIAAN